MIKTVTLLGSSSGRNAGDAALISGIMDSIDSAFNKKLLYEIPTIRPSYILNNYPNEVKPISMLPWHGSVKMLGFPTYNSIMRTDISLLFDAILFDRSLFNPLFNFMSTLYLMLPKAKKNGKKMAFFNVGAGPIDTKAGEKMLREICSLMDFMTVRDKDSMDILLSLNAPKERLMLAADAALIVPPSDEEQIKKIFKNISWSEDDEFLAININQYIDTWARPKREPMGKEKFLDIYSKALNEVLKEIKVPVLFVSTQHHDVKISKELMNLINSDVPKAIVSNVENNHYDIKAILSKASLLAGMRVHSLILATSSLTPSVGIAYQPKCDYYFKSLELSDRMLSFKDFNKESLKELILKGWSERKEIKEKLSSRIPFLQNEAKKASFLVKALSEGKDIVSEIESLKNKKQNG